MIERAWEQKIEPLTIRIATAVRITGLSRSRIYELIQAGFGDGQGRLGHADKLWEFEDAYRQDLASKNGISGGRRWRYFPKSSW